MTEEKIKKVLKNFLIPADYVSSEPYGSGHINDTYAVVCDQGGTPIRFLLQRINHKIFKHPECLMDNIRRVTEHQHSKIDMACPHASRRALKLIETHDNKIYHKDISGNYWRVYVFIEKANTYDVIQEPKQAYQAAKAFGEFQKELVDLSGGPLKETIPNFHNTPKRYEALLNAIDSDQYNRAKTAKKEIEFALLQQPSAFHLLNLAEDGLIPERVTHNDTKLNNVMLDDETGEGICVIDLDTVMPGLALYDFGDMVRSFTRSAEEDERDLSKVKMQLPVYEQLLKGYMSAAGEFLKKSEKENLAFSGKLISLEVGVRFLTDYLDGDNYFKTKRENHNLDRAKVQFKMVESIIKQGKEMVDLQENI